MLINLSKITSEEELIDYFIYYYEYTFTLDEMKEFNIETELKEIVKDIQYKNFTELWTYCYLMITYKTIENFSFETLKNILLQMINNFKTTPQNILQVQIELLQDTLYNIDMPVLEVRPYEQLFLNSTFGKWLLKHKEELVILFQEYIDTFSDISINKILYVKLNKQKYIDKKTIMFELYGVTLHSIISTIGDKDFTIENIRKSISDLCKCFQKRKRNKELENKLLEKTLHLIEEYKTVGLKEVTIGTENSNI